ncbi:hypothetical protein HY448_00770 [Candidatus Pacearchaeota archaeon]|nr:hypothetical protein [Candidatus Pacearchaeota archaeon]
MEKQIDVKPVNSKEDLEKLARGTPVIVVLISRGSTVFNGYDKNTNQVMFIDRANREDNEIAELSCRINGLEFYDGEIHICGAYSLNSIDKKSDRYEESSKILDKAGM